MPRAPQVCTCVFCPHLLKLARLVSSVLLAAPVALFLNLLASVFSIIVSILRLMEMTSQR